MQLLKSMLANLPVGRRSARSDRVAARAVAVRAMFKDAIIHSYHEAATAVLAHVNAVYILKEEREGRPYATLQVYMDDANFRSDVHARQYFIVLWLQERYGETIDEFITYSSRATMRQRHAYGAAASLSDSPYDELPALRPMTSGDERTLARWGSTIEDLKLRNAFLKAARSGLARWS